MNRGQLDYANRKAMQCFDEWNNVTGIITPCCSTYNELQGVIEDAVNIGAMVALGIKFSIVDGRPVQEQIKTFRETTTDGGEWVN